MTDKQHGCDYNTADWQSQHTKQIPNRSSLAKIIKRNNSIREATQFRLSSALPHALLSNFRQGFFNNIHTKLKTPKATLTNHRSTRSKQHFVGTLWQAQIILLVEKQMPQTGATVAWLRRKKTSCELSCPVEMGHFVLSQIKTVFHLRLII